MRVTARPKTGNAVCWNGTNVDEVRAVAGTQFVGTYAEYVLIEHEEEPSPVWVRQGWWIVRWDGEDRIAVHSVNAFSAAIEMLSEATTG